ncbi:hypothetical protein BJY04DRAFT_194124 [Aspergillus karnatakaensis]|uniref:uncharacterized protein n=1 Tax=Aspergillus karnatakaensis TaxID=1810916 RepID=UPI003CCE02D3
MIRSAFLTLPYELRYQIYQDVFNDRDQVLILAGRGCKLLYCICPTRQYRYQPLIWTPRYQYSTCADCGFHNRFQTRMHGSRIALLLTCQQIYHETADLLWGNTPVHLQFERHASEFGILSTLQRDTPHRFHAIRSLEISLFQSPSGKHRCRLDDVWLTQWNRLWELIKSIKGLEHILACLKIDQGMTVAEEERLFWPLMDFYWLRTFKVETTWPVRELRDAPFRLTRYTDPFPRTNVRRSCIVNGVILSET